MFARSATSSARSSAGYVCLACRQERIVSERQNHHSRRWNSNSVGTSSAETGAAKTSAEAVDEWLLPLNSFSEEYGDKKKRSDPKDTSTSAAGTKEQSIDDLRRLDDVGGEGSSQRPDTSRGRNTGRNGKRLGKGAAARLLGNRPRPEDISELVRRLGQANGSNPGDAATGDVAPRKIGSESKGDPRFSTAASRGTPSQRSATSRNSELQALWESLGPGLRAEIDELAAERSKENNEAQYDEYLDKSAAVSVPELETKSTEPVPFPSFAPKEATKSPASSPGFFSSTLKYLKENLGLSRPAQPKPAEAEIQPQTKTTESAVEPSSKKIHSVEHISETITLPHNVAVQKSPVERLEASSSRSPWGTNASATSAPTRRVASFEDIASADHVSVKKPIATSVSARPFGSEPASALADLRGNLAQALAVEEKFPAKSEAAATEEVSKFAAQSSAEERAKVKATPAHSRLLDLYNRRNAGDDASGRLPGDVEDTLDLAFLRRQHNQDRAQQDVQDSIRKCFSSLPLSTSDIGVAVKAEAKRAVEGKARAARKLMSNLSSQGIQEESQLASTGAPIGGLSLGAAMRAGPKSSDVPAARWEKFGRPVKERSTLRFRLRASTNDAVEEEAKTRVTSQELTPEPEPAIDTQATDESDSALAASVEGLRTSTPSKLHITPLDIPQPPVPFLQYGLDRVLFNPGVYQLQDQVSRVYNFDPYLQDIMPNLEFDFDSLKEYKTSSKDEALAAIAKEHGNKYIGSTSSMTSAMGNFHYLLSNWRPLNFGMLSNDFVAKGSKGLPSQLTQINRAPTAIFLRWKNGTYAIDADKEHDSANVLMLLGKSMELLLTLPKSDFERYRKSDPRKVTEAQRTAPESYQYTTMRDFLMRSQLDAYDPRLPGNGTFDLKTRAVVSVRMAANDHEPMTGYEIYAQQGKWGSYEREFFDMTRSTMLKYMLQARMGRMNGIFVAYHNVERMFGFQYLPIADMDQALHGQTDPSLGDQEFRASLDMMNEVFNAATAKFPEQSLRIHFETREEEKGGSGMPTALHVFAEPMTEEDCDEIQNSQKAKIAEWERTVMGKEDASVEDAEGEASAANLSADEMANPDLSNEVAQDDASVNLVDESAEDEATAYSRSLLQSEKEALPEDATSTQASVDSSSSNADPKFLNDLAKDESEQLKPLFYATIIAQSQVNGEVVERPSNLRAEDEWNINYILKEYETGRQQWAMYEDVKARRKMAYVREGEEEGAAKEESSFITFLRSLSEKGRALRKAKDVEETGLPIVRVEELDMERLDKVESVEDYMRFLEKSKVGGTRETLDDCVRYLRHSVAFQFGVAIK